MTRRKVPIPHSWAIGQWPVEVHPGTIPRARYLIRAHRNELIAAGVLARVGRELVVLGTRYERWLETRTADVTRFPPIPPNARRAAAAGEVTGG